MHTWILAHHLARKSDWHRIVADRHRFQRRINHLEQVINPILDLDHRKTIMNQYNSTL